MNVSRRCQVGLALALICGSIIGISPFAVGGSKDDVAAATQMWADAFNKHDVDHIVALYDVDAVLWGTISPTLRDTSPAIRDYFKTLPSTPNLKVALTDQHVRVYGDTAINSGSYTFSNVRDGQPVTVPARFSFVYRNRDGKWLIVDHHSSRAPDAPR